MILRRRSKIVSKEIEMDDLGEFDTGALLQSVPIYFISICNALSALVRFFKAYPSIL
jgi:hypothetical protein